MSYVTYSQFYRDDADLSLTWAGPPVRAIGRGLACLAGGALFAVTMYVMIVLPGLLG
jgi:hypothetical protein